MKTDRTDHLEKALKDISRATGKKRAAIIIRFFHQDEKLVRIVSDFQAGYHKKALQGLISYIKLNAPTLRLVPYWAEGNTAELFISDYPVSGNCCVIRSPKQLSAYLAKHPCDNAEIQNMMLHIARTAKKTRRHILLADKNTNEEKLCRELFHELSAWLYSASATGRQHLLSLAGDWRSFLPRDGGLGIIDNYIYGKTHETEGHLLGLIRALSSKGILHSLIPLEHAGGEDEFFIYGAAAKKGTKAKQPVVSFGVSYRSRDLAIAKCMGEFLERVVSTSSGTVLKECTPPTGKENYFAEYFENRAEEKDVRWIEGHDMFSGDTVAIPAQSVYPDFARQHDEKNLFPFTAIGSGIAAGEDVAMVMQNALYELLERDALMGTFLGKNAPAPIDGMSVTDTDSGLMIHALIGKGIDLHIFEITNERKVPTYLSFAEGHRRGVTHIGGGVKSNLDPAKALYGSVEEAYLEWWLPQVKQSRRNKTRPVFTREWYTKLITSSAAPHAFPSKKQKAVSEHEAYETLQDHMRVQGLRACCYDMTPYWLRSYKVYRVFVPSLQPFYITKAQEWIREK